MSNLPPSLSMSEDYSSWFARELIRYRDDDASGKDTPQLVTVAAKIRKGLIDGIEFQKVRRAVLNFLSHDLTKSNAATQDSFVMFLIQSELIEGSQEIRDTIRDLLVVRMNHPLDRLSLSLASALFRSNKPPTLALLPEVFKRAKRQFAIAPSWTLVAILARAVGRVHDPAYSTKDLVDDLVQLDSPDFERAVRVREAIWASLTPPANAISIVNAVKRKSPSEAYRFPSSEELGELGERLKIEPYHAT